MSRRMVIRCDTCGTDADMVEPAWMSSTAASFGPAGGMLHTMKPQPPAGWFERFAGLQGTKDFCSVGCVQRWEGDHPTEGSAFA